MRFFILAHLTDLGSSGTNGDLFVDSRARGNPQHATQSHHPATAYNWVTALRPTEANAVPAQADERTTFQVCRAMAGRKRAAHA